jgi:hypothetical protein
MAKRKRRPSKLSDLGAFTCAGVFAYYGYPPEQNLLVWIFAVPAVFLFWLLFLIPTKCDYRTLRNKPCDRGVRGKVRGCWDHARWKRDAMFAAVGRRNPGERFRVMWSAPGAPEPIVKQSQAVRGNDGPAANATRGTYNLVMLIATVVSAIAAMVALIPR